MVISRHPFQAWSLIVAIMIGAASASVADPVLDPVLPAAPDLVEAADDLELADQPLTQTEMEDLAASYLNRSGLLGHGDFRWRAGFADSGPRHDGRLAVTTSRIAGRAVWRQRAGVPASVAGGARLAAGPVSFRAGYLGLRHGHGLLAVDAARQGSLAADRSFAAYGSGMAISSAAPVAASRPAAALSLTSEHWDLVSRVTAAHSESAEPDVDLRAALSRGPWETSVLATGDTSGSAVSWAGRHAGPDVIVSWETAWRRPRAGEVPMAGVLAVSWQAFKALRLEVLGGLATGRVKVAGAGAPVLPTGAGRGWAARAVWRDAPTGGMELMFHAADQVPKTTESERRRLQVIEALWRRRPAPGVELSLRLRQTSRQEIGFSERFPWLPGLAAPPAVRTTMASQLTWDAGHTQLSAQLRTFAVRQVENGGRRGLLAFGARRAAMGRWSVRVDFASAWGEPVDLVRAVSPLPGMVVARHWGRWRSEAAAGIQARLGQALVQAAVSRRLPAESAESADGPNRPALEAWTEIVWAW